MPDDFDALKTYTGQLEAHRVGHVVRFNQPTNASPMLQPGATQRLDFAAFNIEFHEIYRWVFGKQVIQRDEGHAGNAHYVNVPAGIANRVRIGNGRLQR
jgi:hypothetical protein